MIHQRVTNLISSFDSIGDDAAWVKRIQPTIESLTSDYQKRFQELQVFIGSDVFLVRTALEARGDSLPEALRTAATADLDHYQHELYDNWEAIGSDVDLLNSELNAALQRSASPAEPDTSSAPSAEAAPALEASPAEAIPEQAIPHSESQRAIIADAEAACASAAKGQEQQTCIFREAWTRLNAAEFCAGSDEELCAAARTFFGDNDEQTWNDLIEEYGAAEDANAGIAVLVCQLNPPATYEDGSPVPLGVCAQVEYLGLTETEGAAVDESVPSAGVWQATFGGECGGAVSTFVLSDVSAESMVVAGDNALALVSTSPGTYVYQDNAGSMTINVIPGEPAHMTGTLVYLAFDANATCPLDLVLVAPAG